MTGWTRALLLVSVISDTLARAGLVSGFASAALPLTGLLRAPRPSRAVTATPRQLGRQQLQSSSSSSPPAPSGEKLHRAGGPGSVLRMGTTLRPPGAGWTAGATQRKTGRGRRGTGTTCWVGRGGRDLCLSSTSSSSSLGVSSPVEGKNATTTAGYGVGVEGVRVETLAEEEEEEEEIGTSGSSGSSAASKGARQNFLKTLWEFSRPHTMIGTAIAIPAIGLFAGPAGVLPGRRFLLSMIWALVPSLLINVYITGLNQITDVEIDKVNKPYLPIPAGNLTPRAAKATVTLCLLAGTVLGLAPSSLGSPGLALTVVLSVLIGTSYSLPPLRLKVAALCILVVRGSIINGGFYSHGQLAGHGLSTNKSALWALSLPFRDAKCALALAYFTVFAVVIALMKDVPDVAGDRKFNIPSFSVVLGEAKLFAFARRLLTALLWSTAAALGLGARAAAAASLPWTAGGRATVATAALFTGQAVRRRAATVNPEDPTQVYDFYMVLWKIFYLSYLFLPLAR